ncbi:O-antigen ligase family protein [Zoogloea sp.]|uniref:O-antigen ligase family protein n=1 Tax=Zoogloea sp. TaxID=49181 RepID=UPI0035B1A3DA
MKELHRPLSTRELILGKWIFIISIFLLGLPLTGVIPIPSGDTRESIEVSGAADAMQRNLGATLIWLFIYCSAIFVLFSKFRKFYPVFSGRSVLYVLIAYILLGSVWSPAPQKCFVDGFQLLGLCAVSIVGAVCYATQPVYLFKHVSLALSTNIALQLAAILIFPDMTSHPNGRWAGMTGSANYLGSLCIVGVWALSAWTSFFSDKYYFLKFILMAVFFAVLLGTNSVTSLAASSLMVFLFFFSLLFRGEKNVRSVRFLFFSLLLFFIVGALFSFGLSNLLELLGREENASGRDVIWLSALDLIQKNPIVGYGFGSDTESLGALHWATTFHNGYLEVWVKLGLIGVLMTCAILWSYLRSAHAVKNVESSVVYKASIYFLVAFCIYNFTETGFYVARSPVWVFFVAMLFFTLAVKKERV